MGKINSPIGSFAQNSSERFKKFTVDDPTLEGGDEGVSEGGDEGVSIDMRSTPQAHERIELADDDQLFDKIDEMRRARNSLDPDKKNKIEVLLGLKRRYADREVDGHLITLRNLSAKETKAIVGAAYVMEKESRKVDSLYDIRDYTLAFSIYAIDGEKISDILGDDDNMETRVSLIEEMPESAILELHSFYESEIAVKPPKDKREAEEVVEDIKK